MSPRDPLSRNIGRSEGAVMVMGVFMAIGLVGAVWYVIGLGDALIYRDKAQEAADSVAFSAATVHARGMNFIAAINVIMLVMTGLFLLIRIFEDFLQLILDVVGSTHSHWGLPPSCSLPPHDLIPGACGISGTVGSIHKATEDIRKAYHNNVLMRVLPALGKVQYPVQHLVTPAGAVAAGFISGSQYKEVGIALSKSMVPGGAGLPLDNNEFKGLCEHAIEGVADWTVAKVKKIPVLGTVLGLPGIKQAFNSAVNRVVSGLSDRYCSPGKDNMVWGEKGYKVVTKSAPNGSDAVQVWGIIPSSFHDDSERRVALPATIRRLAEIPSAPTRKTVYVAQAEYYYDCEQAWGAGSCNGNDNAMFNMKWRARLRRVKSPRLGGELLSALDSVLNGGVLAPGANAGISAISGDLGAQVGSNAYLQHVLGNSPGPVKDGDSEGGALDSEGFDPTIIH